MYDAHNDLIKNQEKVTTESLKNRFAGKEEQTYFLLQLFADHNSKVEALLGNGFAANTLKGYRTSIRHLTGFLL